MKIYTGTGDDGSTGLQGNLRIAKSHPRIMAYGAIDEANAVLGVVLAGMPDDEAAGILTGIQRDLFLLGADLSEPNLNNPENRVSLQMIRGLESLIDRLDAELPALADFILPGGMLAAAQIHHARTIVRRAERWTVSLSEGDEINANCITYLNRLSDLLFVLGRIINKKGGKSDVLWK